MPDRRVPSAPKGLTARSRRLWTSIVGAFEASEAELRALEGGLRELDRADELDAVVADQGVTFVDRFGTPKVHPAVEAAQKARAHWLRVVAQIGVREAAQPKAARRGAAVGRPPLQAVPRGDARPLWRPGGEDAS